MKSSKSIVEEYLKMSDWRVKENSNSPFSFGALNKYITAEVSKDYWLREVYPEHIAQAYVDGHIHIHDLGGLTLYCCGYSLKDVLLKGVKGVPNVPSSAPAKHLDSALNQLANLTTIFQNEIMGAVAFNGFDTLLAPFIKKDNLSYEQVKQAIQNYVFSINSNSRAGAEPAFSNVTFDLTPPEDMLNEYAIVGGELVSFTYGSCQQEMDMLNRAFFETMLNGDADGKLFAYPIPTYNIHKRFDWDNPNNKMLWEMAGKYGTPYFANFINSDLDIKDVRSMCPLTPDTEVIVKSAENGVRVAHISEIYRGVLRGTEYQVWTTGGWANATPVRVPKTKVYEVKFSNGTVVKMGENHLQPTRDNGTLQARDLKVGMWLPFSRAENGGKAGSRELGYAVGAYAGDGSHDGNAIIYSLDKAEKDDETERRLVTFWESLGFATKVHFSDKVRFVRVNGNPYDIIKTYIKGDNALNKEFYNKVFNSSIEFKKGLIEGYRATDGNREKKRLYTSSPTMVKHLCILLSMLGHKYMANYVDEREGRLGRCPNYRVDYPERNAYGDLYCEDEKFLYYSIREIKEVEYIGDYLYCFEVDNDDHLFVLANGLVTHNCRLRLDLTELRHRNGGLFGAGDSTGSIGVVTINLPRIAYECKGNKEKFFAELDKYLDIARDSLEMKRDWLEKNILATNAVPAFMEYVGKLDNHFSTIGVVGMNEMCENFMGKNILDDEAHKFCHEVGEHIRQRLLLYQDQTGHLYNYEATPAESTCYRLALTDKKYCPDIITQGSGKDCYYTNSCHIPVKLLESINSTFAHQNDLQKQFTGGTVIHVWEEGAITGEQAKAVVKAMLTNYEVPYMSLSPISRYCDTHGYIKEKVDKCPICKARLKKYQRITGYLRCVDNYNRGKAAEFKDRVQLDLSNEATTTEQAQC